MQSIQRRYFGQGESRKDTDSRFPSAGVVIDTLAGGGAADRGTKMDEKKCPSNTMKPSKEKGCGG